MYELSAQSFSLYVLFQGPPKVTHQETGDGRSPVGSRTLVTHVCLLIRMLGRGFTQIIYKY